MNTLKADALANGGESFFKWIQILLFHSGYQLTLSYRLSRAFLSLGVLGKLLAKIVKRISSFLFSCEISFHANIAPGFSIPHAIGIVIGDYVNIGSGVTLYQNTTLGQRSSSDDLPEYPNIGNGVTIYAGAQIIGAIHIGDESTIGTNAVVLSSCSEKAVMVGIPAKNVAS